MSSFDVVAIAASAGGVNALMALLGEMPEDFPAAIVIVQHLDPRHKSLMADIMGRHCKLPVKQADEGDKIEPGNVYIAPPGFHMLVTPRKTLTLSESEMVHFVRPSADLLFESVATTYKERAIAVILTGTGVDGAMGVTAIKNMGGAVIAQDKASAEFPGMPAAAEATGAVDFVLQLGEIAEALVQFVGGDGE